MRILIQRVSHACVYLEGKILSEIGPGLVLLVGVCEEDKHIDLTKIATKIANMRIFSDDEGRFNRSLFDVNGHILVVSQFTLYADVKKGRRPSFVKAAPGPTAEPIIDSLTETFLTLGVTHVATGKFGAAMDVEIHNQGPVTIFVDSDFL